jgi:hypothetical protein
MNEMERRRREHAGVRGGACGREEETPALLAALLAARRSLLNTLSLSLSLSLFISSGTPT